MAVAIFPKIDGRNVRGPIARLTIATVSTMTTSRLMIRTVSQSGSRFARPRLRQRQHDEGASRAAACRPSDRAMRRALVFCPERRRDAGRRAPSVRPAHAKHDQRPSEIPVDDEDHERRNQQHAKQRELIRQREDRHRPGVAACR